MAAKRVGIHLVPERLAASAFAQRAFGRGVQVDQTRYGVVVTVDGRHQLLFRRRHDDVGPYFRPIVSCSSCGAVEVNRNVTVTSRAGLERLDADHRCWDCHLIQSGPSSG